MQIIQRLLKQFKAELKHTYTTDNYRSLRKKS